MSRFDNIFEYDNNLSGAGLKVGIVMSRFNLPVCEGLLSACVAELKRLGVAARHGFGLKGRVVDLVLLFEHSRHGDARFLTDCARLKQQVRGQAGIVSCY